MKKLLASILVLSLCLVGGQAVVAAGEREAVLRALESLAADIARAGGRLSWGGIETGGGLFTTDITITDLAVDRRDDQMSVRVGKIEMVDIEMDDVGRIEEMERLAVSGVAIDFQQFETVDPLASAVWDVQGPSRILTGKAAIAEIVLEEAKGRIALGMVRSLLDPSALDVAGLFENTAVSAATATGLLFNGTVEPKGPAERRPGSVLRAEFSLGAFATEAAADGHGRHSRIDRFSASVEDGLRRNCQTFRMGSIRLVTGDLSDLPMVEDGLFQGNLIALAFSPFIREVEFRDHVQESDWLIVTSERDWWRHVDAVGDEVRIEFGSDRSAWSPTQSNPFRAFFERQFGDGGSLVSRFSGTLTHDPEDRSAEVDVALTYERVADIDFTWSVSGLPTVDLGSTATEPAMFGNSLWNIVLDRWDLTVTDHGLRDIAFDVLGSISKEKRSPLRVEADMLNWIDKLAAKSDPATEPLTAAAVGSIKSFVRHGGSLRLATELPQRLAGNAMPSEIAAVDRLQIRFQHTPPK